MPARRLSTESYLDECERAWRLATPRTRRENELLKRHLAAGRLSMPYEGFFLRTSALEQLDPTTIYLHLIRAVAHLHPHWTFCSFTAAVLYGLQVPRPLLKRLHIAVPPSGSRRRLPGTAVCHPVPDNSHTRQLGINVCPILPTLLSCMCQADFRYGLAIVDSALRWQLVDREAPPRVSPRAREGPARGRERPQNHGLCRWTKRERRGIDRARDHDRPWLRPPRAPGRDRGPPLSWSHEARRLPLAERRREGHHRRAGWYGEISTAEVRRCREPRPCGQRARRGAAARVAYQPDRRHRRQVLPRRSAG